MSSFFPVRAQTLFKGNAQEEDRSFTASLSACAGDFQGGTLCAAAAHAGAQEYALAWSVHGPEPKFWPLTPKKVQLNHSQGEDKKASYTEDNPLYDRGIAHLDLYANRPFMTTSYFPVVVLADEPNRLYMVPHFSSLGTEYERISVLSSELVNDTGDVYETIKEVDGVLMTDQISQKREPAPTDGIIGMKVASFDGNALIFLAVKPHTEDGTGVFGTPGSGIAMLAYGTEKLPEATEDDANLTEEEKAKEAEELARAKQQRLLTRDLMTGQLGNRAFPLDTRSSVLLVNDCPISLHNDVVDMCWDATLGRVYIALQVSTHSEATDEQGAIAVLMAYMLPLEDDKGNEYTEFKCFPVAIASDLQGVDNKIVGALGPDKHVSIHKIRTMRTSTYLHYLVVVGGNGERAATKDMVHALPLVTQPNDGRIGMIARKDAACRVEYTKSKHQKFMSRSLASSRSRSATRRAEDCVSEEELFTADDAATRVGAGRAPGDIVDIVVRKDAVFVAVDGAVPGIYHSRAILDATGLITAWTPWERYLEGSVQNFGLDMFGGLWTFDTTNVEKRTWTKKTDLTERLAQELPQELGGVQGFFDFTLSADTPLAVATGYKKVVMIDDERALRVLSGGALDDVAAVTCAQVVTSDPVGWLLVGGAGGLAVLSDENGAAWDTLSGIKQSFSERATFKKLGDYAFVRKLVQDGDNLYVLTYDKLDRIDLTQSDFATGYAAATTLVSATDLATGMFTDVGVSGPFALLATTHGLLRSGNGNNVASATAPHEVSWVPVEVPEGQACCFKLSLISPTGREADFAYHGQVAVMSLYTQTIVNRFAVNLEDEVTDQTLQPLPDCRLKAEERGYFQSFGGVVNEVVSDGASYFQASSRHGIVPPHIKPLVGGQLSRRVAPIDLGIEDATHIYGMKHSPLLASWLVYGDFGLRETN